jgi:hypothetical protein
MTRTIPVSGKYDRQKRSIQCRSKSKKWSNKDADLGTLWKQYHIEVGKLMTSELLGLGLLWQSRCSEWKPRMASLQNTSCTEPHHIGLDTHDYGAYGTNGSQHGFHQNPEFTFQLKVSEPSWRWSCDSGNWRAI